MATVNCQTLYWCHDALWQKNGNRLFKQIYQEDSKDPKIIKKQMLAGSIFCVYIPNNVWLSSGTRVDNIKSNRYLKMLVIPCLSSHKEYIGFLRK